MLGFAPISSLPISAFPYYSTTSGIYATGVIGTVTVAVNKSVSVTGVFGTGVLGAVGAGQGATITVNGVYGTGAIDHACLRTWNEVDTVVC